jgi:selenocysteine-specific elongation factor
MTREELRSRLSLTGQVAQLVLQQLTDARTVADTTGMLHLPGHQVAVSDDQQKQMDDFLSALAADPFPVRQPTIAPQLLALLADRGKVVRAAEGVVFDSPAYHRLAGQITTHLKASGKVTVAEVRDLLGTSRKYALAILEHLDDEKVTRRQGDERVLLQG